jgi:membrane protein
MRVPTAAVTAALILRRSAREFLDDNCTLMAAAISYYVLLSLFPLLLFLVGILGFILQDRAIQKDVIEAVLDFLPLSDDEGRNEVTEAVRGVAGVSGGALGILGLAGMAWSASNMFGIIRRSINAAYDLEQHRPLVRQKILDLAMVLGAAMFFVLSLAATTFLRIVRRFSEDIAVLGEAASRAGALWDATAYLVPFALSFAAFAVLYWLVPATKTRLSEVWVGALVAATLFEGAKTGFAFYLENFSSYDLVYGSLGAVVAFLLWVHLSALILLFGAEVASEYPKVLRGEYQVGEKPSVPLYHRLVKHVRSLFVPERGGPTRNV